MAAVALVAGGAVLVAVVAAVGQAIEGENIAEKIETEVALKEGIEEGRDQVVEQ